ncbi:MAG: F0F1 ATP synthase subunit delta [Prevotellaceae bacterium]|jgi:F-type H+-transporting ATPase subunit delta|nr:F0F1 ATP synthase subunit delta [Prevotellaceae bacterium]
METGILSKRYAKAIYKYALEKGNEEHLLHDMVALSTQFAKLPVLDMVMEDPTVDNRQKIKLLSSAAGENPSETYKHAVSVIVGNGRASYAKTIALMYDKVYRKEKNIVLLKLTTTSPVQADTKQQLVNLVANIEHKTVHFEEKTDDIVGGFILQIEDMRLDASIKNQLNKLKLKLTK